MENENTPPSPSPYTSFFQLLKHLTRQGFLSTWKLQNPDILVKLEKTVVVVMNGGEEEIVMAVVDDQEFVYEEEKHFTVSRTCHFFANDGFTVFDSNGELAFRVDSYSAGSIDQDELVLMDAHGRCLLTVRRKWPSLHNRWEGFMGERSGGQKPIFSVKKCSMIGRSNVTVEMYSPAGDEYLIEGSFPHRDCIVLHATTKECVAEITRKVDLSTQVLLGKDVFSLHVRPGFDGAVALGLVLVLDQIGGNDEVEEEEDVVYPDLEDRGDTNHVQSRTQSGPF